jgi:hypothetical protein
MKKICLAVTLALSLISLAYPQTDSLVLSNKDLMVGEIKSMDKGILTFKTEYSDVDFKVKWEKVKQVTSPTIFLISLSDGKRYKGIIRSLNDSLIEINSYAEKAILKFSRRTQNLENPEGNKVDIPNEQIVYLNPLDEGFWSRLSFNFDVGTNITKANSFKQFTFNVSTGYLADRWKMNLTFNNLRSVQNETSDIKRTESTFNFNYFLQKDWFLLYKLDILSNTEQLLILRNSNMVGLGKYLVHTNRAYLGVHGGVNLNDEKFEGDQNSAQSAEGLLGAQYNIYDIGDLDLLTTLVVYPSLSTKGRIRSDFKFDIRYELKFDLYFKIGTSFNYDNQPTEGASKLDYIFQTTVGWKL